MMVLARREGGKVSFRLREGAGERVPRAPWRIEWGGGASVENPHYQRVHYCQLLARGPLSNAARMAVGLRNIT
jgi:protein arginine N-methyltransferase 7